ncbi:MAG: hypothetical protein A4E37_01401 [Methanoregulaceae archaeon PtaB.Bin056]|jgi:hypothetical protein|nr:MAG: hypothetical protein A4E37_01401 [Methanoregulaceae archaeon PtaB.Bin056]
MIEYWIVVTTGVVAVACVLCGTYIYSDLRARESVQNRVKLKVYVSLLQAVTEINVAGGDAYSLDRAKRHLAFTLNQVNLVAGPQVLLHVNELLDFLNETREGDYDVLKEKNILNAIVKAARRELDPSSARALEESQFRFRFYNPPRQ